MDKLLQAKWWKYAGVALVLYALIGGLLMDVPDPGGNLSNETIRNLYYHVPMWFGMMILYTMALVYSIKYLSSGKESDDLFAVELVNVGLLFNVLGLTTGMLWANYTWGDPWHGDVKQNGAAIGFLVYAAYIVLRGGFKENQQRARISAVYNIFAYAALIPLIWIIPRMYPSLHPGASGNPGFGEYDLNSNMRLVFYPAVMGWTVMALWLASVRIRLRKVESKIYEKEMV